MIIAVIFLVVWDIIMILNLSNFFRVSFQGLMLDNIHFVIMLIWEKQGKYRKLNLDE